MSYRIVADSSSNVLSMDNPHYFSVPMKVRAEKEYVDDAQLDVAQMVEDLKHIQLCNVNIFLLCPDLHRNAEIMRILHGKDIGRGIGYNSIIHNNYSVLYF